MWVQYIPEGGLTALAYSPDGSTLYTQNTGRWYHAWDLATHKGRRLFQDPEMVGDAKQVTNHFPRLFVSPDGRFLVSNTVPPIVWDLARNEKHAVVPQDRAFAGVSMGVGRVRVECVTNDWRGIRSWYFDTQKPGPELRDWPVPGTIKTHHFSPDGRSVALLNWSDVVTICDVESRWVLHTIDLPHQSLQHCRFAPDGNTLVVYMHDGITIWDLPSNSVRVPKVNCDRPYWMLAFHPTAPLIAVRRKDGLPSLIDLRNGEEVRVLDFSLGTQTTCVAFAPDGLTCAVGGTDKRFAVFDVDL